MASHTIDLSDFQLTAAKAAEKCISSPQQIDEVDSTTQRIKRHRAADFNKEFTEGTMLIIASTPPRPTEVFLCKGPHVFLSALNKLAIAIPKFDEDGDEYFIDFDAIFVRNTKKPKGEDWKSWIYPTKPKIMTKKDFQEALSVFQTIIGCELFEKAFVKESWFSSHEKLPFIGCNETINRNKPDYIVILPSYYD